MATLHKDIKKSSKWLINAFKELNKQLDYSIQSIRFIDDLLTEQIIDGKPIPNGLFSSQLGGKIFAIGAYIGEVVIHNTKATVSSPLFRPTED